VGSTVAELVGIAILVLVGLQLAVFLVVRFVRSRPCPSCGKRVKSERRECDSCGFELRRGAL
jgi:rRNA maturation endonuclease Nob1